MKILWFGFASNKISWGLVAQNICRQLKKDHDVHIFSTNGIKIFPKIFYLL